MLDKKHLIITAGDGGDGRVYFRREKYVPKGGPNGGNGGRGGNVIIRASRHLTTLKHLAGRHKFEASRGQDGMRKKKSGAKGEDFIIEVPPGTQVKVLSQNHVAKKRLWPGRVFDFSFLKRRRARFELYHLAEEGDMVPEREKDDQLHRLFSPQVVTSLTEDGQEVVIAQGGYGGRGNDAFKSASTTTPLVAEYGSFGEKREIELELKLLADVGLVGFPSVGKSTLLSVLTQAKPKVAAYHFTTLEPNLGVLSYDKKQVMIADIPGLIKGAHLGKGLGDRFLKHIEHTKILVFVLALDDQMSLSKNIDDKAKVVELLDQLETLRDELEKYDERLLKKPSLIVVNKIDLEPDAKWHDLCLKSMDVQPILVSSKTKTSIDDLKQRLIEVV